MLLLAGGVRDALGVWVFGLWNAGGAACYGIGIPLAASLTPDRTRKPVYLASTAAMLGGTLLGTMAWSESVPGTVARAAREAASGTPYCVMPGQDRGRLKGIHFVTFAG